MRFGTSPAQLLLKLGNALLEIMQVIFRKLPESSCAVFDKNDGVDFFDLQIAEFLFPPVADTFVLALITAF